MKGQNSKHKGLQTLRLYCTNVPVYDKFLQVTVSHPSFNTGTPSIIVCILRNPCLLICLLARKQIERRDYSSCAHKADKYPQYISCNIWNFSWYKKFYVFAP